VSCLKVETWANQKSEGMYFYLQQEIQLVLKPFICMGAFVFRVVANHRGTLPIPGNYTGTGNRQGGCFVECEVTRHTLHLELELELASCLLVR